MRSGIAHDSADRAGREAARDWAIRRLGTSNGHRKCSEVFRNVGPWNAPARNYLIETVRMKTNIRGLVPAALALVTACAFAQTQPTRPSAYATPPTMQSAFPTAALSPCYPYSSFNPTSSCYTGTPYRSYSAIERFDFPSQTKKSSSGSTALAEDEAKSRIEAKGYLDVSRLEKDARGIWRGNATMEDGRSVEVTLDLEGNIYSEPRSRVYIRIRRPPSSN